MGALVEELLAAGHAVQWFVAPVDVGHPEVARLARAGAKVAQLPHPDRTYVRLAGVRRKLSRLLQRECGLADLVGAFRPDHVFLNQGGTWCGTMDQFYRVLETRSGRFSLICHLNHVAAPMGGEVLARARWLAGNATRMFFNSRWTHRLAETQIAQRVGVADYFQYPVRFEFTWPLPWPEGAVPRLAMVNRFDVFHKGIDLAVEAVARLRDGGQRLQLTIVGRGADEAYMKDLVKFHRLKEEVIVLPYTEDLQELWATQEMLLLPSRFEGLAVAMIEAMGFGRPALRTPYGGCEEWIEDGMNGYVCAAAELDLLVGTLKRALSERDRWQEMGLAAHRKIQERLDRFPAKVFLKSLE